MRVSVFLGISVGLILSFAFSPLYCAERLSEVAASQMRALNEKNVEVMAYSFYEMVIDETQPRELTERLVHQIFSAYPESRDLEPVYDQVKVVLALRLLRHAVFRKELLTTAMMSLVVSKNIQPAMRLKLVNLLQTNCIFNVIQYPNVFADLMIDERMDLDFRKGIASLFMRFNGLVDLFLYKHHFEKFIEENQKDKPYVESLLSQLNTLPINLAVLTGFKA